MLICKLILNSFIFFVCLAVNLSINMFRKLFYYELKIKKGKKNDENFIFTEHAFIHVI